MKKVILVDDEILVVKAIKERINWEKCGISEVFLCNNAKSAEKIIEAEPIELVISDIEMPGINGLEFVKRLREHDPDMMVMLLTSFSEFEYAKEAIALGVQEYILKPVIYKELEINIMNALKKVEIMKKEKKIKQVYTKNRGELLSAYIRYLIKEERELSEIEMMEQLEKFHVDLNVEDEYVLVWVNIKDYSEIGWESLKYLEEKIFIAYGNVNCEIMVTNFAEGKLLVLLNFQAGNRNSIEQIRGITAEMIYKYQESCSCYMSDYLNFMQITPMLQKMKLRDERNVMYENKVNLIGNRNVVHDEKNMGVHFEKWIYLLEKGKIDDLISKIEFDIHSMVLLGHMDTEKLREFYDRFMQVVFHYIGENYTEYQGIMKKEGIAKLHKKAVISVQDFRKFVRQLLEEIKMLMKNDDSEDIISNVKDYVEQHLNDKIPRNEIAEYVSLSEGYLSRLFHKETGMPISDYILQRKMSKAKSMLIQTNMPVRTIAEELGYDASAYFIKLFKREFGKTPKEYRKDIKI